MPQALQIAPVTGLIAGLLVIVLTSSFTIRVLLPSVMWKGCATGCVACSENIPPNRLWWSCWPACLTTDRGKQWTVVIGDSWLHKPELLTWQLILLHSIAGCLIIVANRDSVLLITGAAPACWKHAAFTYRSKVFFYSAPFFWNNISADSLTPLNPNWKLIFVP